MTLSLLGFRGGHNHIFVVRRSAVTCKRVGVLFELGTGNEVDDPFLRTDATGRYALLQIVTSKGLDFGWIDNGKLVKLRFAGGRTFLAAWQLGRS